MVAMMFCYICNPKCSSFSSSLPTALADLCEPREHNEMSDDDEREREKGTLTPLCLHSVAL